MKATQACRRVCNPEHHFSAPKAGVRLRPEFRDWKDLFPGGNKLPRTVGLVHMQIPSPTILYVAIRTIPHWRKRKNLNNLQLSDAGSMHLSVPIEAWPAGLQLRGAVCLDRLEFVPGGSDDARQRFERLVLPHLPAAYALARSLTGNRADAEDVVQTRACVRFRAISGGAVANPRAWMLTIVHNTAYTWLSKNRPAAIVAVDDLELAEQSSPHGGDQNTPELAVIAKSEAAHLEAAIAASADDVPRGSRAAGY